MLCMGQEGLETVGGGHDQLVDDLRPVAQRTGPLLGQPHRHRVAPLQGRHLVGQRADRLLSKNGGDEPAPEDKKCGEGELLC